MGLLQCWHWITTTVWDGRFVWMEFVSELQSHGNMKNCHWTYYKSFATLLLYKVGHWLQIHSTLEQLFIDMNHENLRVKLNNNTNFTRTTERDWFIEVMFKSFFLRWIYNVIQWDVILHRQKRYDGYACFYST